MMKQQVILQFSSKEKLDWYIQNSKLEHFTIHKELPVLFCRLDAAMLKEAVTTYNATNLSKDEGSTFSNIMDWVWICS